MVWSRGDGAGSHNMVTGMIGIHLCLGASQGARVSTDARQRRLFRTWCSRPRMSRLTECLARSRRLSLFQSPLHFVVSQVGGSFSSWMDRFRALTVTCHRSAVFAQLANPSFPPLPPLVRCSLPLHLHDIRRRLHADVAGGHCGAGGLGEAKRDEETDGKLPFLRFPCPHSPSSLMAPSCAPVPPLLLAADGT